MLSPWLKLTIAVILMVNDGQWLILAILVRSSCHFVMVPGLPIHAQAQRWMGTLESGEAQSGKCLDIVGVVRFYM